VHAIFICIVLILMGGLSLLAPDALLESTRLARFVLAGFAAFWIVRRVLRRILRVGTADPVESASSTAQEKP
jgi:hypothetical protein